MPASIKKLQDYKDKLDHNISGACNHRVANLRQRIALTLAYYEKTREIPELTIIRILEECLEIWRNN